MGALYCSWPRERKGVAWAQAFHHSQSPFVYGSRGDVIPLPVSSVVVFQNRNPQHIRNRRGNTPPTETTRLKRMAQGARAPGRTGLSNAGAPPTNQNQATPAPATWSLKINESLAWLRRLARSLLLQDFRSRSSCSQVRTLFSGGAGSPATLTGGSPTRKPGRASIPLAQSGLSQVS